MVIGKIKPTATMVAQFAAGVEVEAIQHDGKLFLPVVGMGEFSVPDDAPIKTAKETKKSEPVVEEDTKPVKDSEKGKPYSTFDLMDTKELMKILKNDFGVNPDDFDGKNTHKKLRDLILDAQKNGKKSAPVSDEGDAEEEKPKKGAKKPEKSAEGSDELTEKVGDLLEDLDSGKKNKKKTVQAIAALSEDSDVDAITELVEEFEEDGDADIDEITTKIVALLIGEDSAKKEKAAPAKGKSAKKENLVKAEDLEKGDRVSVWWDDEDNKEWYDGEVKSIKKGKVLIAYDDESEEIIDPEVHTKIKRLAE